MATVECPHCNQVIYDVSSTSVACGTCPHCGEELPERRALETEGGLNATIVHRAASIPIAEKNDLDALVGMELGGCVLEGVLGRGAMGVVYQAKQASLDRAVAVKVIRKELCHDPDLLTRFQREAKMIGRFTTEHVVQVHDVGEEEGHHFLVMELVDGGNLLTRVAALPGNRLPPNESIKLLIEAAEGLQDAERLGIVHRDIKPENLLIDSNGKLKIADFGISRSLSVDVQLTRTEVVIGTPLYMSPEQCRGEKVDARSDMYALGATFCHLLAGRPPLHEKSVPELLRRKTTIESLSPRKLADDGTIPESLSRVIERMTALDRDDRYPNFGELLEDLVRVERGEIIVPFERRAARKRKMRRLAWGSVTVVALAGLGLGGDYFWRAWRARTQLGGGTAVLTAEQIAEDTRELRRKMAEQPVLVTQSLVADATERAARAESPELGKPLLDAAKDAERLVSFRTNANQVASPRFAPPFAEVEETSNRLRELSDSALLGRDGPELQGYVKNEMTRRNAGLVSESRKSLQSSAASLAERCRTGSPTPELLTTARQDLDNLRAGAVALDRLFPDHRDEFAQDLPPETLERIGQDLKRIEAAVGGMTDAAGRDELARLQKKYRESGPTSYDLTAAMSLRGRLPVGSPVITEFEEFAKVQRKGEIALGLLEEIKLEKPNVQAPFDELVALADRSHRAVEPEPDYHAAFFNAEIERRLGASLEPARAAFAELQQSLAAARTSGGDPDALSGLLDQVEASQKNLTILFPARKDEWAAAIAPEALAAERAQVRQLSMRKSAGAEGSRAIDAAKQRLDSIKSAADWRAASTEVDRELAAIKDRLAAAGTSEGATTSAARLAELERRAQLWSAHVKELDRALALVAGSGHDVAGAAAALAALAGDELADPAAAEARAGVAALAAAFDALRRELDLRAAEQSFTEAARRLAPDAGARGYSSDCGKRLAALVAAVGTMEPVPAGKVRLTPSGPTSEVDGFFLDRCEVSIGDFAAFLEKAKAERATWMARIGELPGFESADGETIERRLLSMPRCYAAGSRPNERLPVEQVSYAQALLFLKLRSKDLPTFEEWWLAAKGSLTRGDHRRFPCSESPRATLRQLAQRDSLVYGRGAPIAVDEGGVATGFSDADVHHLSGNVEEWTRVASGAAEARVVGGGYTDGAELEEYFAGERTRSLGVRTPPERRVGFRGVLRPGDFFAAAGLAPSSAAGAGGRGGSGH